MFLSQVEEANGKRRTQPISLIARNDAAECFIYVFSYFSFNPYHAGFRSALVGEETRSARDTDGN